MSANLMDLTTPQSEAGHAVCFGGVEGGGLPTSSPSPDTPANNDRSGFGFRCGESGKDVPGGVRTGEHSAFGAASIERGVPPDAGRLAPAHHQAAPRWNDEASTQPGVPQKLSAVPDRPVLVWIGGEEAGRACELSGESMSIGRGFGNAIVVEDSSVSRHHARIGVHDQSVHLEDTGSENGTYVNGHRTRNRKLQSGDLVQFGVRVVFVFLWVNAAHLELMRRLYDSSTTDGLTGVHNRKHFQDRLAAEVAFCRRHGTELGIITLDIDRLKPVNEQYGQSVGDAVLQQIAKDISRQVRAEDLLARIGGDEFSVMLRATSTDGCYRLGERLRMSIAAFPVTVGDLTLTVTVSLGCASLKGTEVTAQGLMALADRRLRDAKSKGRNCTVAA